MVRLYRTRSNINYHCDGADVVGLPCLKTADHGGANGTQLRTFYHSDYFRSLVRHVGLLPNDEQAMLDLYEEIAERPDIRFDVQFEPGDIQLLLNHTVIHARTAYEDGALGKRHLLRLWLTL